MPVSIFRENNKRVCIDINTNALPVMVLMVFQRYVLRVECHCRLAKTANKLKYLPVLLLLIVSSAIPIKLN